MRRKILWSIAAALALMLAVFIWRLDLPHWKKLDMDRIYGQGAATEVFDRQGNRAGTLHGGENRLWISIDDVPQSVQDAFIAAEDLRFYRHHGVDVYRMFGALWNDIRTLSFSQGASTITQQLIKLTHLSSAKSLARKGQEIVLALQLERVLDKRQILEAYLNTVYFGHGAYGIEAAANTYFNKDASQLTVAEGALLAGVIKSPSRYAPHLNPDRAITRRNGILETMAKNGFITEAEANSARNESLRLEANKDDSTQYAWYMDSVLLEAQTALGLSADEVLSGGYSIYTGLDSRMQDAADALFEDADVFPGNAADGTPVQASLVALDTSSGEIRCVVGGRHYDVTMGLNRATQIGRQPGSAFKPVSTYAAAIDAFGFVPSSTIEDTPRTFEGGYAPRNAGGNTYGTVTLREALSRSLNIATVDLADLIGVPELRAYAARFGIPLSERDASLSLALGALTDGVSPARLGAAYCALANGGARVEPHFIRSIADADGRIVYKAPAPNSRAVRDSTAYMLTDMLKTAATSGSARAVSACGMPVAAKTGTVGDSEGTRDVWTVAYTPELATAVWMGFDAPDANHMLPASEGGSGYPARLCAAFYNGISGLLSHSDFQRPASVRTALVDEIALREQHVALLATDRTPSEYSVRELFHENDLPEAYSGNWTAPRGVQDLRLLTGPGETPVIAFTPQDKTAEYLLIRKTDAGTEQLAVLRGKPGQELRYADTDHDTSQPADYTLMPRNALLYATGALLAGPNSQSVHYAPGGFLNTIMGAGTAEATPAPTEVELGDVESLFD